MWLAIRGFFVDFWGTWFTRGGGEWVLALVLMGLGALYLFVLPLLYSVGSSYVVLRISKTRAHNWLGGLWSCFPFLRYYTIKIRTDAPPDEKYLLAYVYQHPLAQAAAHHANAHLVHAALAPTIYPVSGVRLNAD